MSKLNRFFLIILLFLFTVSCASSNATGEALLYFPFNEGNFYKYTSNLMDQYIYIAYSDSNKMQRLIFSKPDPSLGSDNFYVTELFKYENGKVVLTYSEEGLNYDNMLNAQNASLNIIVLQEPINLNSSWNNIELAEVYSITDIAKEIHIDEHSYDTVEISMDYNNGESTELLYYAKDIGLIQNDYETTQKVIIDDVEKSRENSVVSNKLVEFKSDISIDEYKKIIEES